MEYDEPSEDVQYLEKVFEGRGRGKNVTEAMDKAFQEAWENAKAAGKTGRPLRVAEQYVWGSNPPNWYKVVLVADG